MDIVELLQREIQDLKMAWSKLKEENVNLQGFKSLVMGDIKKYSKPKGACVTAEMKKDRIGHNGPPESIFDEERKKFQNYKEMYEKEHKLRQEAETETILVKGIGINSPEMKTLKSEVEALKQQLHTDREKYKRENNDLYNRIAELTEVDESHQKLNGKLQMRITELEEDNKKLTKQIEDYIEKRVDASRRSGM
jgi:FtsZ-binding cell division protein ZapB/gas vesicle protein